MCFLCGQPFEFGELTVVVWGRRCHEDCVELTDIVYDDFGYDE